MNRTIIYSQEQPRTFDFVQFEHDVLVAMANTIRDAMGANTTVLGGFAATPTGPATLNVNIAAGRVYQQAPADATSVGAIAADSTVIQQQGAYAGAQIALSTAGISAGQSRWALVQAQFSQSDIIRAGDPNGGIPPFFNAAVPSSPLNGQGGLGLTSPTERAALGIIQVITGASATTGSEVPPNPTSGWAPLYLIDLTNGQTQITSGQILVAGPSVGTNVPNNYPVAPFLAGLLNSHHSGNPGQAPKINLATETQGVLPYANMSPVRTLLTANLTLFISPSGNNGNSGLSSGSALLTMEAARAKIYQNYDFGGFTATINVANGTYSASTNFYGLPVGYPPGQPIFIVGNNGSPSSVVLTVTNGTTIQSSQSASVTLSGVLVSSIGTTGLTAGVGLAATSSGTIGFTNIVFGQCDTSHTAVSAAGVIAGSSTYSINGNSPSHMGGDSAGLISINGCTVTLNGTPAFSVAFAVANRASAIQAVGATFVGGATGPRFLAATGASIDVQGAGVNFLPGSTAGNATGGYYF